MGRLTNMNVTSFVQIDKFLAFNPGYITKVQFGSDRVSVYLVDNTSFTLTDSRFDKFLDWWDNQAIVMTNDSQDGDSLYFIRGQPVPEASEM
jgi:hypothetical protein